MLSLIHTHYAHLSLTKRAFVIECTFVIDRTLVIDRTFVIDCP